MESLHNTLIIHAFNLAQKRFFSTSKLNGVQVPHSDMYLIKTIFLKMIIQKSEHIGGKFALCPNHPCLTLLNQLTAKHLVLNAVHVPHSDMYPMPTYTPFWHVPHSNMYPIATCIPFRENRKSIFSIQRDGKIVKPKKGLKYTLKRTKNVHGTMFPKRSKLLL